mmetsp:Transcript_38149/g.105105  ORF Transcript_38149/g.105105 Transcript_38149/m.105105 type:complete len:382 (-) Transcript_38149:239-1384(-)
MGLLNAFVRPSERPPRELLLPLPQHLLLGAGRADDFRIKLVAVSARTEQVSILQVQGHAYASLITVYRLVVWVLKSHQVWMRDRLLRRQSLLWVPLQQELHEVVEFGRLLRKLVYDGRVRRARRDGTHAVDRPLRPHGEDVCDGRFACQLDNPVDHVASGCARQQCGTFGVYFSVDASHGPHVDGHRVHFCAEEHLRATVPARPRVVRHQRALTISGRLPSPAEIGKFHVAVPGQKHVRRLDVAVHDTSRVYVFQGSQEQPHDQGIMDFLQRLHSQGLLQVGVHQLEHQIQMPVVARAHHVEELDDAGVAAELQQVAGLTVGPLRIMRVLECVQDLLDRKGLALVPFVLQGVGLDDYAVAPAADALADDVPAADVRIDLLE